MTIDELVEISEVRTVIRSGKARRIRLRAGLSLGEVAQAVGVGVSTVCRWEMGERAPRGPAALRYGEVLEGLSAKR